MWRVTRSNRVLIDGLDLQVDQLDSLALAKGWYEPNETAWYKQHVEPGHYVVEAGGNVGFFTLMLAREVGATGRVVSYEPDPRLRAILHRNLDANFLDNVIVRPYAVADKRGKMTFYRARKNQGDNRLFSHGVDGARFEVEVIALDQDLGNVGRRIDLLKLDIQGAEPLALRGMASTLAENPPRYIMMEFWPHGIYGMNEDPTALIEQMAAYGYSIRELDTGATFDVGRALIDMTDANLKWVNLVLEHSDQRTES